MSSEEIIKFNVQYDVRGIDTSIRQSQRLLYFMNAVRLSATDLQQVMSGPTIANVMWTAVQLTRVWTTAYRWVKMTNEAQRVGMAQGIAGGIGRGAAGAAARRFALGQTTLSLGAEGAMGVSGPQTSLWAMVMASLSNPYVAASVVALALMGGWIAWDRSQKIRYYEWQRHQRETAKLQGLEW